jgi:hypothetical protein
MVTAYVQDGDVHYVGELTAAVLEEYGDRDDYSSYVTSAMRDAIASNQTLRSGRSVVVPVNGHHRCDDLIYKGPEHGRRQAHRRRGDGPGVLRFEEPAFDPGRASEYALGCTPLRAERGGVRRRARSDMCKP